MEKKFISTEIDIYSFEELPPAYRELIEKAKEQTKNAYAPYSEFKVGSALLLDNGVVVGGNNQENAAYPSGLCAERVSLFYANSQYPDVAVDVIAVAAFTKGDFTARPVIPCAACLQVLIEKEIKQQRNVKLLLYGKTETHMINSVKEVLPLHFDF